MSDFYINKQGTAISSFKTIDNQKTALFSSSSLLDSLLNQNTISRNVLLAAIQIQLDVMDSAMANYDTANANNAIEAIELLFSDLEMVSYNGDSLFMDNWVLRNNSADPVIALNSAISVSDITESNEKSLNEIGLMTIAKHNSQFTSVQLSILESIANQCPVSGGQAVFRARAILALVNPNQHYDDRDICEPFGGIRIKNNSNSKLLACKVYPNPAMNSVTLEISDNNLGKVEFSLMNATGQKLLSKSLPEGQKSFIFNIASFDPGVYQYQIVLKNQSSINGKLVVIK